MTQAHQPGPSQAPLPRPEVRAKVKELLGRSEAFHRLPPARQKQVARDTALVADALVGKTPANAAPGARALAGESSYEEGRAAVDAIGQQPFQAGAAREGATIAGEFLRQVNFVEFVSGLIDGVFNSIVTSSIEQMEAYSKMVADVSKSLDQFRDENTTEQDGEDQLVDQFPDIFDLGIDDFSGSKEPKLKLRDDVDQESALTRVQNALGGYVPGGIESIDVSDPDAQARLITAARSHIATGRQQLLATMVLLGLNRIVVTNGKISAKVLYDFNAATQRQLSRAAQARDLARDAAGELVTAAEGPPAYTAGYYTRGLYRQAQRPIMTAMSVAQDASVDQLTARASLAGNVDVNFRSDFLPLDKVATPEMMAAIQMRSKPIDHNKPQYKPTEAQPTPAPQSP
jgi:hypothetical protein